MIARKRVRHVLAAVTVVLLGAAAVLLVFRPADKSGTTATPSYPSQQSATATTNPEESGVVQLMTTRPDSTSECSGLALDSEGHVLTIGNCVEDADVIEIKLPSGKQSSYIFADVVGYHRLVNVAVIAVKDAADMRLAPVRFGDSSTVAVGEPVVGRGSGPGIGKPLVRITGRVDSLKGSTEVRGAAGRVPRTGLMDLSFDCTAADSGGPLIDDRGQVVGLLVQARNSANCYAIPINRAKQIADDILAGRAVDGIHLGETAKLGVVTNQSDAASGVVVREVLPLGPASATDLAIGDVITSLGGAPVTSSVELVFLLDRHRPLDVVELAWTDRAGSPRTAKVRLGPDGEESSELIPDPALPYGT